MLDSDQPKPSEKLISGYYLIRQVTNERLDDGSWYASLLTFEGDWEKSRMNYCKMQFQAAHGQSM